MQTNFNVQTQLHITFQIISSWAIQFTAQRSIASTFINHTATQLFALHASHAMEYSNNKFAPLWVSEWGMTEPLTGQLPPGTGTRLTWLIISIFSSPKSICGSIAGNLPTRGLFPFAPSQSRASDSLLRHGLLQKMIICYFSPSSFASRCFLSLSSKIPSRHFSRKLHQSHLRMSRVPKNFVQSRKHYKSSEAMSNKKHFVVPT